MPVRHPILNGFGRLGLGEAAAKMIDYLEKECMERDKGKTATELFIPAPGDGEDGCRE